MSVATISTRRNGLLVLQFRDPTITPTVCLLAMLLLLTSCATGTMPEDSPAARYNEGGAAAITGAYDFGLF